MIPTCIEMGIKVIGKDFIFSGNPMVGVVCETQKLHVWACANGLFFTLKDQLSKLRIG